MSVLKSYFAASHLISVIRSSHSIRGEELLTGGISSCPLVRIAVVFSLVARSEISYSRSVLKIPKFSCLEAPAHWSNTSPKHPQPRLIDKFSPESRKSTTSTTKRCEGEIPQRSLTATDLRLPNWLAAGLTSSKVRLSVETAPAE